MRGGIVWVRRCYEFALQIDEDPTKRRRALRIFLATIASVLCIGFGLHVILEVNEAPPYVMGAWVPLGGLVMFAFAFAARGREIRAVSLLVLWSSPVWLLIDNVVYVLRALWLR